MDHVYSAFLRNTFSEARDIALRSDVVRLLPEPVSPPTSYMCSFDVPYLRRLVGGTVHVAPGPVLGFIRFPQDYLCSVDPRLFMRVASIVTPDFVHPNAVARGPVCLGAAFRSGTPLGQLIWELYQIVTYQNRTLDERNALNPEACRLLRANQDLLSRFPAPPLFRRRRKLQASIRKLNAIHHAD
jgi:hypothetical protein